jgi:uncharacterized protein YjbI with pentapeptide repeats
MADVKDANFEGAELNGANLADVTISPSIRLTPPITDDRDDSARWNQAWLTNSNDTFISQKRNGAGFAPRLR